MARQNDESTTLVIGVLNADPYVSKCFDRKLCPYRGLAIDTCLLVCEMMQWRCSFRLRSDMDFGTKLPNQSAWDGAIGDIHRGLVDTYVPVFTPTSERMEATQFSKVFLHDSVVLMTRMPVASDTLSSHVLRAFSIGAWTLFAVSLASIRLIRFVTTSVSYRNRHRRTTMISLDNASDKTLKVDSNRTNSSASKTHLIRKEDGLIRRLCRATLAIVRRETFDRNDTARNVPTTVGVDRNDEMIRVASKQRASIDNCVSDNQCDDDLTCAQRCTYVAEWLMALIVSTTVSGVTVSKGLTVADRLPFLDVVTFANCMANGQCRLAGTSRTNSYLRTMTHSENPLSRQIGRALAKYPLTIVRNDNLVSSIVDTTDVFLTVMVSSRRADYVKWLYRGDRQFHIVHLDLINTGTFPFRINDNRSRSLDDVARRFAEMGFDRYLYRKYGEGHLNDDDRANRRLIQQAKVVRLRLMADVFLITTACLWTSIVAFIVELSYNSVFCRGIRMVYDKSQLCFSRYLNELNF